MRLFSFFLPLQMHLKKRCFPVNPLSTVFGITWYEHSLSVLHSPSPAMAFLSVCVQQPGHPVDHLTWFKLNCIKPHRENPVHSLWWLTPGCLLEWAMPLALLSMKCHWLGGKSWQEDRKQHSAFSIWLSSYFVPFCLQKSPNSIWIHS